MKAKKQFLKLEEDHTEIIIGLVRLIKAIPEHELFFLLNKANDFSFRRIEDIEIRGEYFDYYFSRYQAYDRSSESRYHFISNRSVSSIEKKAQNQLFSDESDVKHLLNFHQDVDYILSVSDIYADFSLILHPKNLGVHIQQYPLSSDEELYHLIQYYE